MLHRVVLIVSIFCIFAEAQSAWYPRIDTATAWTVTGFVTKCNLVSARKTVKLTSSTSASYQVFDTVQLWGIKVDGVTYPLSSITEASRSLTTAANYKCYYGDYDINGTNYRLAVSFFLYYDGQFKFIANWSSTGGKTLPASPNGSVFFLRVDYDLGKAGGSPAPDSNDIIEVNRSVAYTVLFGSAPPYDTVRSTIGIWQGLRSNFKMYIDTLGGIYNPNAIENNSLFRIVNVTAPDTQFYAVFWPHGNCGDTIYAMNKLNDLKTTPPTFSNTNPLQDTATASYYQPYSYHGRDQVAYLACKYQYTQNQYMIFGVWGKVFQKPNGRSLRVYNNVMTGATIPDTNFVIDTFQSVNKTYKTAMNSLTNSRWQMTIKQNISDPVPADTSMTLAQIHNFMLSSRDISPTVYTAENRQNYQDWFVEVSTINKYIERNNQILGVMFDCFDPSVPDANSTQREGSCVSWRAIAFWWANTNDRNRISIYTNLHEMGHCFNFQHVWSDCGLAYNSATCVRTNRTIMSYAWQLGLATGNWCTKNSTWYKSYPESWVKPGRYGSVFNIWKDTTTALPGFQPYQ